MKVIKVKTGEALDVNESFGARLIEQGAAVLAGGCAEAGIGGAVDGAATDGEAWRPMAAATGETVKKGARRRKVEG